MTLHYFCAQQDGRPLYIEVGWDRPLNYFFLRVEYTDTHEVLYESVDDLALLAQGRVMAPLTQQAGRDNLMLTEPRPYGGMTHAELADKLEALRIQPPDGLLTMLKAEQAENAAPRCTVWQGDGHPLKESP